jgi:hypothetical protein
LQDQALPARRTHRRRGAASSETVPR